MFTNYAWNWKMDYCHRRGLSPADADSWRAAERAFIRAHVPAYDELPGMLDASDLIDGETDRDL